MGSRQFPAEVAFAAFVVAVPIATFWLVGDLSEPGDPYYLDHFVKPSVSEPSVKAVGVTAVLVLSAASVFLLWTARPLRQHLPAFGAALKLALAGEILAVGARVMTAGTSGANIGAGLFDVWFAAFRRSRGDGHHGAHLTLGWMTPITSTRPSVAITS